MCMCAHTQHTYTHTNKVKKNVKTGEEMSSIQSTVMNQKLHRKISHKEKNE